MSGARDLPTPLFDPEVNRAIHEAMPELVIEALGLITRLGDGATLVGVAVLLYWFGSEEDRHKRAMVLAIAVSTLAVVAGLKGILEVQRPLFAAELAFAPETYSGYSTPSAHSMGAAAVYGALAVVMNVGKRWQRFTVAGALIVLIPLSRVVIGVHYVGDVILGVGIGLGLVVLALRMKNNPVTTMFAFSLLVALGAFALGSREFTTMAIGASLGGLIVWGLLKHRTANPSGASILLLGIFVLPLIGVFRVLDFLIAIEGGIIITGLGTVPFISLLEIIGYGLAFGGAIAVPFVAPYVDDTPAVHRLQTLLPFRGREFDTEAVGTDPTREETPEF